MRHGRSHERVWGLRRRPVTVAALALYLVAAAGVPLPAALKKQRDAAFPCQAHACGCQNARECWEHCCCYSPTEKLAWAREHRITPPARLVAVVEVIEANPLLATTDEHHHDGDSACHDEHAAGATACCPDHSAGPGSHATTEPTHAVTCHHAAKNGCCEHDHDGDDAHISEAKNGGKPWVLVFKVRQCRGLGELWCMSGAVLGAPDAINWDFQWDLVERLAPRESLLGSADLAPPRKPPRV